MSDRDFAPGGRELRHEGHVFSVFAERFRFADGEDVTRDVVRHPGAVAMVVFDDDGLYLVRQPRPAVGDPDVLELPAGRLDVPGEEPLETAKRELAEEIGKAAAHWEHLVSFWSSVGMTDEEVHVFLATDLSDAEADSGENERIEIVRRPLSEIDALIGELRDAKTLIGLMALQRRR